MHTMYLGFYTTVPMYFTFFMCVGRIKIYLFISNIQDIVNSNRDHTFT